MFSTAQTYPDILSTILVVDDHELVLRGIKQLLEQSLPNACILTAGSGEETLRLAGRHNIALVTVDLELPDMSGINLIDIIREDSPGAKVLVNTVHDEIWTVKRLMSRHVEGIIFKSAKAADFIHAVVKILEGGTYYDVNARSMIRAITSRSAEEVGLSAREVDVLGLIAEGLNTDEIGCRLGLKPNTIETHRRHLLEKMGVKNAAELVRRAISAGILSPLS